MNKILLISFGILLLVGTVTAISLSDYSKVREETQIKTDGICGEKVCDKNIHSTLSLENSGLKIDVLKDSKTNKEILHIYGK